MFANRCRLPSFGAALVLSGLAFMPFSASAQSCNQTLSAGANVGAAISGAAAGSTICLNNGNYSGFTLNGVSKSPRVTVLAVNARGASFTSGVTLTGNTNGVTFDGVNFTSALIYGASTREITLRNFNATGKLEIDAVTIVTPNILFENFTQSNLMVSDANPAGIHFSYSGRSTPVATIRNATIDGGCADGIQSGVPFVLEFSRIMNKQVGTCPNDPHTDGVQLYGGPYAGTIIRNNYFYRDVQVLSAYDGVDNVLIENNIFDPGPDGERRPCQIEWYSDANSIIRHNTVVNRGSGYGYICLDRKSVDDAGYGTVVVDNIALGIVTANGSTYAQRTKNLVVSGAATGDVTGSPTFVGGAIPTTVAGFQLASNSLGKSAASSPPGSDIGADTSSTPSPTPNPPSNIGIGP